MAALNLQKLTQKGIVPYFFIAKKIDAAHAVCADHINFWGRIFLFQIFVNFLLSGPALGETS